MSPAAKDLYCSTVCFRLCLGTLIRSARSDKAGADSKYFREHSKMDTAIEMPFPFYISGYGCNHWCIETFYSLCRASSQQTLDMVDANWTRFRSVDRKVREASNRLSRNFQKRHRCEDCVHRNAGGQFSTTLYSNTFSVSDIALGCYTPLIWDKLVCFRRSSKANTSQNDTFSSMNGHFLVAMENLRPESDLVRELPQAPVTHYTWAPSICNEARSRPTRAFPPYEIKDIPWHDSYSIHEAWQAAERISEHR